LSNYFIFDKNFITYTVILYNHNSFTGIKNLCWSCTLISLSTKADTHFTIPRSVEGWDDSDWWLQGISCIGLQRPWVATCILYTLLNSNYFCVLNTSSCCTNQIYSEYGFKMCKCDCNASDSWRCENTQAIAMSITVQSTVHHQFGLLHVYLPRYVT